MLYNYFISYKHARGFGNKSISLEAPIKSYKDLLNVEKIILEILREQEGLHLSFVVVDNFQLFELDTSEDALLKIKKDHQKKSNQVKKLQRKLKNKAKNTISKETLQKMLAKELAYDIDPRDYYFSGDDSSYSQDIAAQKARREMLEEIISQLGDRS